VPSKLSKAIDSFRPVRVFPIGVWIGFVPGVPKITRLYEFLIFRTAFGLAKLTKMLCIWSSRWPSILCIRIPIKYRKRSTLLKQVIVYLQSNYKNCSPLVSYMFYGFNLRVRKRHSVCVCTKWSANSLILIQWLTIINDNFHIDQLFLTIMWERTYEKKMFGFYLQFACLVSKCTDRELSFLETLFSKNAK